VTATIVTRRRAAASLLVCLMIAGALSMSTASPAAAAGTCPVVSCPPTVGQIAGVAVDLIPGLGAASAVIGAVGGAVGGAVASVAQGILDQIGKGIADAVTSLFGEVAAFLTASSSPQVTVGSFVTGNGAYHQVAVLAALAMILFMFFAVIQGLLAGDPLAMFGRMLRNVPLAMLAIIGFPWAVDQLVALVDAICASLLPTGATLTTIASVYAADQVRAAVGGFGVPAILCELFVFLGGVLIYAELVVRAALVTVVVALAPLSFAAMVWPAARGAARKVVELVVAIVLSKLAIWVALLVGIGLFSAQARSVVPGGQAWGQMISGTAIIGVAVFAPFVVWRLLPVAEAAVVAQGLSRMPGRAALNTAQTANMARGRGGGGGGGAGEHPALAELPSRSLDPAGTGAAPAGGPAAGARSAAAGGGGAGAASQATGGSAGAASAGTGAAAGASAGAAAGAAAVVAETAKMVKDRVVASADAQSLPPTPPDGGTGGWSFRKPDDRGGEQ
jgi:hypothetical protein